ncbi:MAG TPA: sulfite exporter TauE/SafE family protein [Sphingomonas sp.]|nr:sulfite exporter TauE/SafE family protein [Sphingomonas sp.]
MTIGILAVLFLATLIRSVFGFGEALIAVPLLAFLLPVDVAAPIAALSSITVAIVMLARDWSHVHVRSAGRLVLATLFGIPLGLLLLTRVPEPVVKALLGGVIIAFSLHALLGRGGRLILHDDRFAWAFGLAAGVLGGAYGMNGPPLVVYGTLRRWPPPRFRATLQGYFLPASMMVMAGYAVAGLWTREVTGYYLLSLPPVLVAILLGRVIGRYLDGERFLLYVHAALVLIGLALLGESLY